MNKTKTRTFRSCLALFMALCMVFGLFGPATSIKADAAETESLKYVSLGDSMTNGYGLSGYDNNGYNTYGEIAYPNQFADWLIAQGYADEVEHSQLAMSAMRAEDLHFILEFPVDNQNALTVADANANANRENDVEWWNEEHKALWNDTFTTGDYYTWDEFTNDGRFFQNCGGTNAAAQAYQNAVREADIISLGIGNANFGVFLMGRLTNAIGFGGSASEDAWIDLERALAEADSEIKAQAMALLPQLESAVKSKLTDVPADMVEPMVNAVVYTAVSYVLNYAGVIEAILQLNSDAEIILVGIMNTMAGMDLTIDDNGNQIVVPMTDVMNVLVEPINAYIAALPTVMQAINNSVYADAAFYFAEAPVVECMVTTYEDALKDTTSVVRARFVEEVVGEYDNGIWEDGMVWDMVAPMFNDMLEDYGLKLVPISLADIEAYEENQLEDPSKMISCAVYKAFEDAIVAGSKDSVIPLESFTALATGLDGVFGGVAAGMESLPNEVQKAVEEKLAEEISLWAATEEGNQEIATVMRTADYLSTEEAAQVAFALYKKLVGNDFSKTGEALAQYAADKYMVPTMCEKLTPALTNALTSDETLMGLLHLFGRMLIGNGLGAHPSVAGHKDLTVAVTTSYGEGYTAKDETVKNVKIVLDGLYDLIQTYGPEVAAQVWAQWEEYGYVDAVNATIAELETMLQSRYTYYTETALPAIGDSIAAMTEQKDVLADEIAVLKAELAAKKAELAEVIANQEIGDIYVPDINIDVELGDNEQTEVPDRECVVEGETIEAELNAAIADLEHAIAVIEALIADIDADIADMIALAEQIAAAVAELEKTMIDVAAAIEDLSVAFDQVVAVLKDNEGVVDAVVSSYEAARATALAAAEVLDLTMGTANEMMGDIDAMITIIAEDAEALYNKFVSELPGCIEQIPEEAAYLAAPIMLIQQYVEENKEEINAKLQAEIMKLAEQYDIDVAAVQAQIDELTALFNADEAELTAKLQELAAQYGIDEAAIKAELAAIEAQIKAEADALYTEKAAEFQAQIDALNAEASAKLDALNAELAQYEAELAAAADDAKAGIQAQIDRVLSDIDTVNADLACAIGHVENAAQLAYDEIVAEVAAAYEEAVAELQKALDELKAAYDAATADVQKALDELKAAFDEAIAELQEKLDELKAAYDKAVDELTAAADKAIADLIAEAEKQIAELGKLGDALNEALDGVYEGIHEELSAAQTAIEEILKGQLESVKDLVKAVADLGVEGLNEIVNELVEQINALIAEATTADLVVDDEFKYVALGDSSAAAESYVEKLAAALNAEAAENGVDAIEVVNYAKAGNTVAAERANLSDVSGADLITIGFSNVEFLSKAVDAALSQEPVEFDWAAVVGAENVQYVDQMLAEVAEMIAENGIEGEAAVMVNTAVEAYAYAAAQYATELPELVNEINAVNPDAVVIVVGMYNPMDGVVITLDENVTLDISEYLDHLVDGVAAHGIAYSIISGNSIYVDAPEVSTTNTDSDLSIFDLARMAYAGFNTLYPSVAGDDYIAAEIADALNITYVKSETGILLGDADGNGYVNSRDAMLVAQYFADPTAVEIDLVAADVDGNGYVNSRDAMLIAQHFADYETGYPIGTII